MSRDEIRELVLRELHAIAPEAELEQLDPKADMRDALDLDSMDVLRFATALHERLGIDIPESAYAQITSVQRCVEYLAHALDTRSLSSR
ncbi:MAG: acyl carrier protein [Polyangiales bacterium]